MRQPRNTKKSINKIIYWLVWRLQEYSTGKNCTSEHYPKRKSTPEPLKEYQLEICIFNRNEYNILRLSSSWKKCTVLNFDLSQIICRLYL
ncbi:XXYS1_4_G0024010.mRNA.1.CDS.1 [Saccharomyces cerevisiae]|nr:XXYS1_4_G0024010.mRNA.1.CDS.1 [Saccharomyces cerevisiae]